MSCEKFGSISAREGVGGVDVLSAATAAEALGVSTEVMSEEASQMAPPRTQMRLRPHSARPGLESTMGLAPLERAALL